MTTLAEAIIYDKESSVIKTIKAGADVNETDQYGFRPLIQAVICKKKKVLQCLLEYGADLEQTDFLGRTPLQWASDREEFEFCEILLQANANPNHYSADGQPILVNPILREQLELVNLFVKFNANTQFAQDFISAKLIGHRFELTGEADIVSPDGKFIPLSFEGFYLEFSTNLLQRSLNNFVNSIDGQKFESFHGKLQKILTAMKYATQLTGFSKHKNKSPFENDINDILTQELLLIPAAYKGHAITFVKYKNLWAKCDRGVGNIANTVIIYEIGNPFALTRELYYKILYEPKTEEFVKQEIKEILNLTTIKTLPTRSQLVGNCSWANIETSVPTMLFMLSYNPQLHSKQNLNKLQKSIYNFYHTWINWDKNFALDEALEDFELACTLRKLSKAIILGGILIQRSSASDKSDVLRAKKILSILTQPNFQFILENYRKIYFKKIAGKVGEKVKKLFASCDLNINNLSLDKPINYYQATAHDENLIKMTTALHVACLTGKLEMVKYLVEKIKIDINYLDRTGSTALMYAAWKGYFDIVKYLIKHNANINIKNLKGGTANKYASHAGNKKIVKYLKEH